MKRKVFFKNISGEGLSPLEIYLKFLDENNSYFFESVEGGEKWAKYSICLLYTSPSPRDKTVSRMPSSA